MNLREAQEAMYRLSEVAGEISDQIDVLDKKLNLVHEERRELIKKFSVLDIRRIGDRKKTEWTDTEVEIWGEGRRTS